MEAKTNYTLVGLVVLILIAALLGSALWLSTGFGKKSYTTYAVYMKEAVSGLNPESLVKFNGVTVGSVDKITLSPSNPQHVELLLNIEDGTPITTHTSATLIAQGITGTTYVGLSTSSPDLTPLLKLPGQPYPIIPSKPSLLNQLDKTIKEVSDNLNSLSERVKNVFDDENTKNLKKTLKNLEKFTSTLARDIKQIIKNVANAGDNVSSTMKAGKITLNKFSSETIPPAVSLLQKLNRIAANLEKVSSQMRQNPSVIIRGTKPQKPGPGE